MDNDERNSQMETDMQEPAASGMDRENAKTEPGNLEAGEEKLLPEDDLHLTSEESTKAPERDDPLRREQEVNTTRNFEDPYPDESFRAEKTTAGAEEAKKGKGTKGGKGKHYVTMRGLILALVLTVALTSALTLGGLNLAAGRGIITPPGENKRVSATNYTLAQNTDSSKSVQEIIAMNADAVVDITTESKVTDTWMRDYVTKGAGSGVIIQQDGYIMTCNHVVNGATAIKVTTSDGTSYDATLVGADAVTDIAVLKIEAENLNTVVYGDSNTLQIGDMAVALGNPLGQLGGSATAGIISSLDRELEVDSQTMNLLQTDASVNPGNSGGGLFNGSGNLIGIVVAKSTGSDVEGLGFAIPINTAAEVAKQLIENGRVKGRAAIGVNVLDLTDAQKAQQYGMRHTGIYVAEVVGEEAKKAGFQKGDILYEIDGEAITSSGVMRQVLQAHKPGDEIEIVVIRDSKAVNLKTVLTEQGSF